MQTRRFGVDRMHFSILVYHLSATYRQYQVFARLTAMMRLVFSIHIKQNALELCYGEVTIPKFNFYSAFIHLYLVNRNLSSLFQLNQRSRAKTQIQQAIGKYIMLPTM